MIYSAALLCSPSWRFSPQSPRPFNLRPFILLNQFHFALLSQGFITPCSPGHDLNPTTHSLSNLDLSRCPLAQLQRNSSAVTMTITSVQTVLPGRFAVNASERRVQKPPPETFSVPDFPFKGYQQPQPEGFAQSQANPDSAIVIDNGKAPPR